MTRSSEAGFTLIEMLQAVSLSAIGLLALSSLTMGTIHANAKARRMTGAATLAQAKMEEIHNLAYPEIVSGFDEVIEIGTPYERVWSVCANCPVEGTKEVTLTIEWADQGMQTLTLETIISDG